MFGPLLDVRMSCRVAGARDSAPCQKGAKREGFAALPKTMAAVGHLKGIWKDAFRVADAIQETALHSTSIFEGSHAELVRFLCCHHQKIRKSRRIASFFALVTSNRH